MIPRNRPLEAAAIEGIADLVIRYLQVLDGSTGDAAGSDDFHYLG